MSKFYTRVKKLSKLTLAMIMNVVESLAFIHEYTL